MYIAVYEVPEYKDASLIQYTNFTSKYVCVCVVQCIIIPRFNLKCKILLKTFRYISILASFVFNGSQGKPLLSYTHAFSKFCVRVQYIRRAPHQPERTYTLPLSLMPNTVFGVKCIGKLLYMDYGVFINTEWLVYIVGLSQKFINFQQIARNEVIGSANMQQGQNLRVAFSFHIRQEYEVGGHSMLVGCATCDSTISRIADARQRESFFFALILFFSGWYLYCSFIGLR